MLRLSITNIIPFGSRQSRIHPILRGMNQNNKPLTKSSTEMMDHYPLLYKTEKADAETKVYLTFFNFDEIKNNRLTSGELLSNNPRAVGFGSTQRWLRYASMGGGMGQAMELRRVGRVVREGGPKRQVRRWDCLVLSWGGGGGGGGDESGKILRSKTALHTMKFSPQKSFGKTHY